MKRFRPALTLASLALALAALLAPADAGASLALAGAGAPERAPALSRVTPASARAREAFAFESSLSDGESEFTLFGGEALSLIEPNNYDHFEVLAGVRLLALDTAPALSRARSKTHIGVFEIFGSTIIGVRSAETTEWHWGSERLGLGTVSELFDGAWTDPVTGLAYHRARWYDPRNGTWLSEDPLGAVDSENLYAFGGMRPNSVIDPMGTDGFDVASMLMRHFITWATTKQAATPTQQRGVVRAVAGCADSLFLGQSAGEGGFSALASLGYASAECSSGLTEAATGNETPNPLRMSYEQILRNQGYSGEQVRLGGETFSQAMLGLGIPATFGGGSMFGEAAELEEALPSVVRPVRASTGNVLVDGDLATVIGGSTYAERMNQTPLRRGWWSGQRGESTFFSYDPEANTILTGRGIPYRNARPNFSAASIEQVEIAGMSTDRGMNFSLADEALAKRLGVSAGEIELWRKGNKYTWHEVEDLRTMQLVPSRVNNPAFKHMGGVGELKRGARRTP